MNEQNKCREVHGIFSDFNKHVIASKSLIQRPYREEDVLIKGQILETMDDGMEIELCLWTDCDLHMTFWDVSVNKELFGKSEAEFLSYLQDKGVYLEDVKDAGGRWCYCGTIEEKDVYRIQYVEA